jgi:putative ABC transport system permease protein
MIQWSNKAIVVTGCSMGQETEAGTRLSLFWRLWFRALTVKRPQAALAVGSLLVGAAVISMLLNLYADVRRKMTQEFRAYGANVVLAAGSSQATVPQATGGEPRQRLDLPARPAAMDAGMIDEGMMSVIEPLRQRAKGSSAVPVLYVVTKLEGVPARQNPMDVRLPESVNVVAVGADFAGLHQMNSGWRLLGEDILKGARDQGRCVIGDHLASTLHLGVGDAVRIEPISSTVGGSGATAGNGTLDNAGLFPIAGVLSTGASEDDQVFVPLPALQHLTGLEGKLSLVELSVPGDSAEVEQAVRELSGALNGIEVRPIRQIVYSEGKVVGTLRALMVSLTALILAIIVLCVMATMTTIVLERRKDIGVMKALGASDRLVMQLFMSEGAGLGLVGGLVGFVVGAELARALGRRLFGVSLNVAWWTLPLISAGSILLALLATAFPVRIVRNVKPAVVLKGE